MNTFTHLTQKSAQDYSNKRVSLSPVIRKFSRPILFKDCNPNEKTLTSINKHFQYSGSFKISYFSIPPIRSSFRSPKNSDQIKVLKSPLPKKFSSKGLNQSLSKQIKGGTLSKTLKPKYINLEINPKSC
jgi:hypothetical protein